MLSVDSKNIYYNPKPAVPVFKKPIAVENRQCNNSVALPSFKGNFTLVGNISTGSHNAELKHIADVLKSFGVQELEIGDNIELARLLKSSMYRVKMAGFDIPTRIRCESKFFKESAYIRETIKTAQAKADNGSKFSVPGAAMFDNPKDPILYLDTERDWKTGNGCDIKSSDPRHVVWHETGHWLQMKDNPFLFNYLVNIGLPPYEKRIVERHIGNYAAENSVLEATADIFATLMRGGSYNEMDPEVFNIYAKYHGPMPKTKK